MTLQEKADQIENKLANAKDILKAVDQLRAWRVTFKDHSSGGHVHFPESPYIRADFHEDGAKWLEGLTRQVNDAIRSVVDAECAKLETMAGEVLGGIGK